MAQDQALLLKRTSDILIGTYDFRELAVKAVDLIVKELKEQNLIGAAIFRVHHKDQLLYAYEYATKYRRIVDKFFPVKFSQLHVPLSLTENLLVRTVATGEMTQSPKLFDFSVGSLTATVTGLIDKTLKTKLWLAFPIRTRSGKIEGVILYGLLQEKLVAEQLILFQMFADQLGLAFSNVFKFEQLMAKYNNLLHDISHAAPDSVPDIKFTLRITSKQNKALDRLAKERGKTKAELMRDLLDTL